MVLQKYEQMVASGVKKMEEITTKQWWEHLRFSRIGHALGEFFNKYPQKKQESVEHFVEHGGKLSYKDFFKHVDQELKINL